MSPWDTEEFERNRLAVEAATRPPTFVERLALIGLAAWYATGGDPEVDATDAWNYLCGLLEKEQESFPDECRAVFGGTT